MTALPNAENHHDDVNDGFSVEESGEARLSTLVVDLDGTLTPTDTLIESMVRLVKKSPFNLLRMPFWLLKGRAAFKNTVAARSNISAAALPYRDALLTYLQAEKASGRRIILATAAHRTIADAVADHLGLFDAVLATEEGRNLKGSAKLDAIKANVDGAFVYAGDSKADIPIWKAADGAILAGASPGLAAAVRRDTAIEREFPNAKMGLAIWVRAMRLHQWLKNLLLFIPLLTAFSFLDIVKLPAMAIAFLAFSFAASATYMVNDLWDLESDRAHPRKRLRPFASARIPIAHGIAVAAMALALGFLLAVSVSQGFALMLLLYLAVTSAYSFVLKSYVLIDVLVLSLLYTLRILAGSVASGIAISSWLLAFSVFLFLSLALVKRCAELVSLGQNEQEAARGRDYRVTDLTVLWPLGIGAALSAIVIFGLFIDAPETRTRYLTPQLLWLVALGLIYWVARLWIKTSRGEMHDDPIVYAMKDRGSRVVIFLMMVIMFVAHQFSLVLP